MNSKIEKILSNFIVDNTLIPFAHKHYEGSSTTYITYEELDMDGVFYSDDKRQYFTSYYDFDIYTKNDYTDIVKNLIKLLENNDFRWRPDLSSEDDYDYDTKYNHKTLCFAIERNDI